MLIKIGELYTLFTIHFETVTVKVVISLDKNNHCL